MMMAPQPGYIGQQSVPPPNVQGVTEAVQITCPNCKAVAMTNIQKQVSPMQWIICILCFLFCFPCTFFPCYISSCYKTIHKCSHCQNFIGCSQ
mmetsp:Transcript_25507/g.28336  ORF Transcript_25507/g.28336 Transcript_25507/m.28336 type:complete len:93 (-) Transcript_25507:35-313(-)